MPKVEKSQNSGNAISLVRTALPIGGFYLTEILVGLTDLAVVGTLGTVELAAVGLGKTILLSIIRPGSDAVISRLCDVVVMQCIRAWMEGANAGHIGWLKALKDRNLGRVIAQIHADPAQNWTLASLAAVAGLSRSAFAARFSALVGEPAMRYVTRCRMHRAAELLNAGDATVADVAEKSGYQSEAAFSRAYKRITGVTPRGA